MVRRDTDEIYTRLDDEQSQRHLLAGQVNMLFRDRRAHAHTRHLMETEARLSREAWRRSMDASDLARGEAMSLHTTTDRGRREEMRELRATDHTRQQQIIQTLTVMQTLQREMTPLQGLVTTLQGQVTALQGHVMALQGQTLQREMTPLQGLVTILQGQVTALQGQVMALQGQVTALQASRTDGVLHSQSCQRRLVAVHRLDHVMASILKGTNSSPRSTSGHTTPAFSRTATTTTTVTNAQLQAMIDQGVTAALAAHDATRNGIDSHTSGTGVRGSERVARECTYQDFMKCKPLYFKGTEGVIELTQWFERMETVFRISNCPVENQVKFSTCTLLAGALTWWNSHVMTVSHDTAYAITWADLRKKMTDKYCPRTETKSSEPKTMQEAVEMATELMDKKVITIVKDRLDKRKFEKHFPKQSKPNSNRTRDRTLAGPILQGLVKRSHTGDLNPYALNATITTMKTTCFEWSEFKGHCQEGMHKVKDNKNHGNQVGNDRAPAKVYAVGRAGTNPDSNIMTGTFLLNNRYASILFDTGADRSFVSTAFSSQLDITPTVLDHYYDVELADGRVIGLNTILRGCTLNILNHPFNDAIIGMD
ncbi:reverse transcriptase domain-containing protein, partial [Tanacetum coccineum]